MHGFINKHRYHFGYGKKNNKRPIEDVQKKIFKFRKVMKQINIITRRSKKEMK